MQGGKRHNMNTPYNATNLNEYMYLYILELSICMEINILNYKTVRNIMINQLIF